ncbi:MAG: carbon-nitrogen hydrolase family protein [Planctomycetes bacterium]|nr:carbon-nitrogen hydrolase family protein [Planctomycetota bacterium]
MAARIALLLAFSLAGCASGPVEPQAKAPPRRDRVVRVVTISQDGIGEKQRVEATLERLTRAASFKPDIACLPETLTRGEPETVPGPTTERVGAWAREHSSYVICPLKTREGGTVHNTAVLLDREGRVVGRYHKIHPTEDELKDGVCPGAVDPPVFDTDFGRIGIQICFDVNWRESWIRLREKGAQIIFWPSAYPAARQLPSLAWQNKVFVVTSTISRPSRIYDITGDVLDASDPGKPWAGAALPLGKRLFETDFNAAKARQMEKKYAGRVQVTWYKEDDWFTVASLDPELTVEDLMKEYGLTPLDAYVLRAGRVQDEARQER